MIDIDSLKVGDWIRRSIPDGIGTMIDIDSLKVGDWIQTGMPRNPNGIIWEIYEKDVTGIFVKSVSSGHNTYFYYRYMTDGTRVLGEDEKFILRLGQ